MVSLLTCMLAFSVNCGQICSNVNLRLKSSWMLSSALWEKIWPLKMTIFTQIHLLKMSHILFLRKMKKSIRASVQPSGIAINHVSDMLVKQISKTAGIDTIGCILPGQISTNRAADARLKNVNAYRKVWKQDLQRQVQQNWSPF